MKRYLMHTLVRHLMPTAGLTFALAGIAGAAAGQPSIPMQADAEVNTDSGDRRTVLATHADAAVLVNDILNRWEPVAIEANAHPARWRELFATQLTRMDVPVLQRIDRLAVGDSVSARSRYARFEGAMRNAQMQSYMLGQSGKGPAKLGSATNDQVFIPIVPCRVVDTRNVGGPITAGSTRNFYFYTHDLGSSSWASQGGTPGPSNTACPGTVVTSQGGTLGNAPPTAAMATVTVVNATAAGNWGIWGGAGTAPSVSALNWAAGQVLANTTVLPAGNRTGTGPGGAVLDFAVRYNGPSGQADIVVDIVGYFVENVATPLDCIETPAGTKNLPAGSIQFVVSPQCPTGYSLTGGECGTDTEGTSNFISQLGGSLPAAYWTCYANNPTGTSATIRAYAICCRVPGM